LREHGEAVSNGPKGDLYVNIELSLTNIYQEGDLILSEEHVGMVEAALGTEIEVSTVDGMSDEVRPVHSLVRTLNFLDTGSSP